MWPDARRLAALAGLSSDKVFQCEASDLAASGSYVTSAPIAAQWDLFIDRACAASSVANGHSPLRRALAAALHTNHRHVPPRLKEALVARDLGALILILLDSGKPQAAAGGGVVGTSDTSGLVGFGKGGDTSAATSEGSLLAAFGSLSGCGLSSAAADGGAPKRLAGSVILEVLALASRYVVATDDATRPRERALRRAQLPSTAFVSYPILERIAAVAQRVAASAPTQAADAAGPADATRRRQEVRDAAAKYLALLARRNGN